MTEPTDAELIAAWKIEAEKNLNRSNDIRVGYARAVLAKWGTPPAVVGEPYGYVHTVQVAPIVGDERKVERTVFTRNKPPCDAIALYTTPQPTQAQAGAVPLTDEQIKEVMDLVSDWGMQSHLRGEAELDAHNPEATDDEITYAKECAEKERAAWNAIKDKLKPNGIKGGQHG